MALLLEAQVMLAIDGAALRLPIRPLAVITIGPGVPRDAEPGEIRHLGDRVFGAVARLVRVFYAEQEAAALRARQQEAEKCRTRVAGMQRAGRTGCESRDEFGIHRRHSLRYRTGQLTRPVRYYSAGD